MFLSGAFHRYFNEVYTELTEVLDVPEVYEGDDMSIVKRLEFNLTDSVKQVRFSTRRFSTLTRIHTD